MDEKEIQDILIEILYSTVNEEKNDNFIKQKLTSDILISVYRLAKKHDLAHVVSNFVYRNQIEVDSELRAKLQKEEVLSIYRNEQMKYAFEEICEVLDGCQISYIPLKGSVIRPYYPYDSMRTSCDIDILIHKNDVNTAIKGLQNKGYFCGERNYHDVSLYSPNKVHLELHFSIQENMRNLDRVLKDAWEYAIPIKGTCYQFTEEFFAFHIFAHMAYHFISGGCGIRALLDIWVMEHKMGIVYSCAKELLEKAEIYQFAMEMSRLSDSCFLNSGRNYSSDLALKYIFQGGVYGCVENHIAVKKSKSKNSISYMIKRCFPSYSDMLTRYSVLKKAPFLLPFCWIARWFKAIFRGKINE